MDKVAENENTIRKTETEAKTKIQRGAERQLQTTVIHWERDPNELAIASCKPWNPAVARATGQYLSLQRR